MIYPNQPFQSRRKRDGKVKGRGKRPSHTLVPRQLKENIYRIHTRYSFNIALPNYFKLCVSNRVLDTTQIEEIKKIFQNMIGQMKLARKELSIERIRVNFMSQEIIVDIIVIDCLYDANHMKQLAIAVYERFRSLRDEVVRPAWLQYIEENNIPYRIRRPR